MIFMEIKENSNRGRVNDEERLRKIDELIYQVKKDIEIDKIKAQQAAALTMAYRTQELSEDYMRLSELLEAKQRVLRYMRNENQKEKENTDIIIVIGA